MATATEPLPMLASDEAVVPVGHGFDAFHQATAPLFDTGPIGDAARWRSAVVDYLVGDVVVSRLRCDPQLLRRTPRHVGDGGTDWITVQVHHRGGMRGEAGRGTPLDLDAQRIGIVDLAHPFAALADLTDAVFVAVPRTRLRLADQLGSALTVQRSSTRGKVLDAAVADLWRRLAGARAADAEALADGFTEMLDTVLAPGAFAPTDRDRRLAMEDFIRVNLRDLDLGADSLQATFHWSRATVYRLFEPHGGVDAYIRAQRLLRCFEELSRPAKLPRRIADVATRWGFENPSHFNRLFKHRFGLAPSAVARSSGTYVPRDLPSGNSVARIRRFREWAESA